jgi:hypothetical protein
MATLKPNFPDIAAADDRKAGILLNEHIYGRWADSPMRAGSVLRVIG